MSESNGRVESLYGYARTLARNYANGRGVTGYDEQEDVMGEALLALVEADKSFKEGTGMAFRTWAHTRINSHLENYFTHKRNTQIPLPEKLSEQWQRIQRDRVGLCQQLGREPTNAEWATACGITMEEFNKVRDLCSTEMVSMDAALGEDEDGEEFNYHDVLADDRYNPEDEVYSAEVSDVLGEFLDGLTPDETSVLYSMYGLGDESDGEGMNMRECAEYLGVSLGTVHNLHTRALAKLRGRGLDVALGIDTDYDRPLSRYGEED